MVPLKQEMENKYLVFGSADKNKEVLEKYTKLWDRMEKTQ